MSLYLAIRDVDTSEDPERAGAPALPDAWWDRHQRVGPWWTWRRPGTGQLVAAARCNAIGGRGLYAVYGPQDWLESLAAGTDEVMPGREAWRRGVAGEATPRMMMRAWRWWRCDVTERAAQIDVDAGRASAVGDPVQRNGVRRVLSEVGVLLPDPTVDALPWDLDASGALVSPGAAVVRVRALVRPALGVTSILGHRLHRAIEDEPDRGV